MTREDLIAYTKTLLNEVTPSNGLKVQIMTFADDKPVDHHIDLLLDECACQVLLKAPSTLLSATALAADQLVLDARQHCATLSKPADYLRLLRFSLPSWRREVYQAQPMGSPCALRVGGLHRRGTPFHPVVIERESDWVLTPCLSSDSASVDTQLLVVCRTVAENLPLRLQWSVAWLCASRVLQIMGQTDAALLAEQRMQASWS